jgi:hypothetical protein
MTAGAPFMTDATFAATIEPARSAGTRDAPSAWPLVGLVLVIGLFAIACYLLFSGAGSADLSAVWLAGGQIAQGRPDLVYPPDTTFFSMLPPPEWTAQARAEGMEGDVFPYIYPPIWAQLAAYLHGVTDRAGVMAAASLLNPILMALCLVLAHRIAQPRLGAALYTAAGLVFLSLTSVGLIALGQNQPQILVAFLVLLAVERSESGAPVAAGIALAVAAAIKGYPAMLALVWLLTGQRRAVIVFALTGAALGALSVALAGWPLHRAFLRASGLVAGTGLMNNLSYTIDAALGNTVFADRVQFITSPFRDQNLGFRAGWKLYEKPGWAVALGLILQVGILTWLALALRGTTDRARRGAMWAAGLTFATLVAPVGWSYYYLAPAAFLPLAIARWGFARGLATLVALALPVSVFASIASHEYGVMETTLWALGLMSMTGMGLAFLGLARGRRAPA